LPDPPWALSARQRHLRRLNQRVERCRALSAQGGSGKEVVLAPDRHATRIADHPAKRLSDLLPWNWTPTDWTQQAA
jgi:hypothetical protein